MLSRIQLFAALWTVSRQAPLSRDFSGKNRSGLQFPSPGDAPDPDIEPSFPMFPALQVDALTLNHQGSLL